MSSAETSYDSRFIPMDGVHNFRDYGGYSSRHGGQVKTGLLWRSGHHSEASDADLAKVDEAALAHVIDLRGNSERAKHACRRSDAFSAEVLLFDGETAGLNLAPHEQAGGRATDAASAHEAMTQLYANLPNREPLLWILRHYFAALSRGQGASLVHCAAGKDRTGMACDLLHHVLGVHPDDAMADYLLTNHAPNNEERIEHGRELMDKKYGAMDIETVRVLMGVHEDYLHAARKAVEASHGSVDAFLRDVLEVDDAMQDALRLHYLSQ